MTNPTNWPNPERPGYHWLKCKSEENSELEMFHWDMETQMFLGVGDSGCIGEVCFADHWEYHGPCFTPTQIAELLAGERERVVAEAVPKILVDLAELPDRTSPEDAPDILTATAEEIEMIVTQNIRNLGAAP